MLGDASWSTTNLTTTRDIIRIKMRFGHSGTVTDADDASTIASRTNGSSALWQLRGLQSTAAFYPSMFRTWPEFRQYVQAQKAFGTNQIEMGGAPVCDANGNIAHTRLINATLCKASVQGMVNFSREPTSLEWMSRLGSRLPCSRSTGRWWKRPNSAADLWVSFGGLRQESMRSFGPVAMVEVWCGLVCS